ncbi:MAG: PIN domain-containing protein [Pseudomonadota bacterium]|nr:PIN domain-containing protein [Pseudomonadota bacterium]
MIAVFVDTHVLLHGEDGADPMKHAQAVAWLAELWKRRCGRLSTQVLNEFYVTATRRARPPMPAGDARAEVRRYQRWQPWQVDHATVESAWAIESRYKLGYGNSLVVAAAQHLGCRFLLSEDMPHEQRIDGVQIINPFLVGPGLLDTAS